jgi:hypothetical protein
MRFINISEELLEILEPYSEWFFQQDLSILEDLAKKNPKNDPISQMGWGTSSEYLDKVVAKDGEHEGYPEISYSYDLQAGDHPEDIDIIYKPFSTELCNFLGARNQAVHVFYPKQGYMGWHNNWNAHGYNILLSYSPNGRGFFKYRDPKTHEIIRLQDPAGWSCKVGYYGRGREPDKVYYHCAGTSEPRLTLGYVIPHLGLWQDMVSDISGESADHLS